MELQLIIAICFMFLAAMTVIIGITIHDIRMVKIERLIHNKHRFRKKPFVSIVVDDTISNECITSINKSDYRKFEIVFTGEKIRNKLVLRLGSNIVLERTAVRRAVRELNAFPSWSHIEIRPIIKAPVKLTQLFHLFHLVALSPFISARATFNIAPVGRLLWPTVQRTNTSTRQWKSHAYIVIRWLAAIINAVILIYITYLAMVIYQPILLLSYIGALTLWLTVGLLEYPHFSAHQKNIYTLLIPVSYVYFFLYALYAPFAPIIRKASTTTASFLWRSHRQTVA